MKALSLVSRICCFVCVALMLALIVVQFLPNWNYEATVKHEDGTKEKVATDVSLAEITWFPHKHKELTKAWNSAIKKNEEMQTFLKAEEKPEFKMNGLVPMPILSAAAAAFGIFLCALKSKAWGSAIFPIISGWAIFNATSTHPIIQLGAQCQTLNLLGIVTMAVGAVALLTGIVASILGVVAAKAKK